jgi:hypothetical protein
VAVDLGQEPEILRPGIGDDLQRLGVHELEEAEKAGAKIVRKTGLLAIEPPPQPAPDDGVVVEGLGDPQWSLRDVPVLATEFQEVGCLEELGGLGPRGATGLNTKLGKTLQ